MAKSPKPARRETRGLTNHLKRYRSVEGIKRSVLGRKAEVSERTIHRIESGHESTPETLHRLVNAVNKLRTKRTTDYEFKELFPKHKEE